MGDDLDAEARSVLAALRAARPKSQTRRITAMITVTPGAVLHICPHNPHQPPGTEGEYDCPDCGCNVTAGRPHDPHGAGCRLSLGP